MPKQVVIAGAGPAGLACAYRLVLKDKCENYQVTVIEKDNQAGGLAKTINYKGFRFDVGGHRFYSKIKSIQRLYKNLLGRNMLERRRLSRIYYQKKFFNYPLTGQDIIKKIGLIKSWQVFASYLNRQLFPYQPEENFRKWVSNRFGDELFKMFFKSYTEKVWGVSCDQLSSLWAKQRIQNFSLFKAAISAFFHLDPFQVKTMIKKFLYPKYGPGMFFEQFQKKIEEKGKVILSTSIIKLKIKENKVVAVIANKNGKNTIYPVDIFVSTMPLNQLIYLLQPPAKIRFSAKRLNFRGFICVNLIINGNPFPDNWIYIHNPDVKVARVQNFSNWSKFMSAKKGFSPISLEYFATLDDQLWKIKDENLLILAKKEAEKIALFKQNQVIDGLIYRVKDAYPIYNLGYEIHLSVVKKFLEQFSNVYLAGRGGLFRYNNMDHSILSGYYVADNILSEKNKYDVWSINEEESSLEENG